MNDPAARLFQDYLASQAALCTADAGNKIVGGDHESDKEDSQACAERAKLFVDMNKTIDEINGEHYKFEVATLTHNRVPITKTIV